MDPITNPYVPGAGTPPPELAGRSRVLEQATVALARAKKGRSGKSLILVGLRGVGKTVLLVKIADLAGESGYEAMMIEAQEGKSLPSLIVPSLRKVLFALDRIALATEKAKRGLRVLRSFMNSVKISVGDVDFGLSIEPEKGTGDSGNLETDLSELFIAIGEAAKAGGKVVVICLDELQYLSELEFGALIMAIHRVNQLQLPVILVGAGLPQILGLAGESKSYAERLFDFPPIGALAVDDAKAAIEAPAAAESVQFTSGALDEILRVTERYPYFLQQWAHEAWNLASQTPIDFTVVQAATASAISSLDKSFFRVRFDRCTPSERRYLRALAELGPGPQRSGEIAEQLSVKPSTVAPARSNLIRKGMIYSQQYGDTEFTVPMFDAYMRRVMPGNDWRKK
jgi:AAA ATPase-like protein